MVHLAFSYSLFDVAFDTWIVEAYWTCKWVKTCKDVTLYMFLSMELNKIVVSLFLYRSSN